MSLSRRDFEAVADVLRRNMIPDPDGAIEAYINATVNNVACGLAEYFAASNPGFDPKRFFLAVGQGSGAMMTEVFPTLDDIAPDLSEDDALRLVLTVEHGYAHPSPMLRLLVDLGYLWDSGLSLYPSVKGQETALGLAEALWRQAEDSGTAADRLSAYVRYSRLRDTSQRAAAVNRGRGTDAAV